LVTIVSLRSIRIEQEEHELQRMRWFEERLDRQIDSFLGYLASAAGWQRHQVLEALLLPNHDRHDGLRGIATIWATLAASDTGAVPPDLFAEASVAIAKVSRSEQVRPEVVEAASRVLDRWETWWEAAEASLEASRIAMSALPPRRERIRKYLADGEARTSKDIAAAVGDYGTDKVSEALRKYPEFILVQRNQGRKPAIWRLAISDQESR